MPGEPCEIRVTCATCNLRETCLFGGVPTEDLEHVENIVYARRQIRRGERLFCAGDEFKCLFAIRSGFFKTSLIELEQLLALGGLITIVGAAHA